MVAPMSHIDDISGFWKVMLAILVFVLVFVAWPILASGHRQLSRFSQDHPGFFAIVLVGVISVTLLILKVAGVL